MKKRLPRSRELKERYQRVAIDDKGQRFNTDLLEAWELGALLDLAEVTAVAALNRTESRGAHAARTTPSATTRTGSSTAWPAAPRRHNRAELQAGDDH